MALEDVGEYNPCVCEERILKFWKKNKVKEKTFLTDDKRELFSFLEGPPTANAPPALHHVEMRTFKDIVNRFHYMCGYSVPRKAGWDCHGLPVEVQVEKELELNDKNDIVKYGVDKFVNKCRESVFSHISEWDALTERMAYWVDLEDPYITMDNNYIESVWWSLKQLWDKNLLYEGYRVVPMCPRCGTPLSSHEVAQGYKTVKEDTVIVSLPVKNGDYSFLAWTTTPWTLLSNVALAVHPKVDYAKILYKGEKYVMAKELAEKRFPESELLEEFKGLELIGEEYHPLFTHFIGKLDKPAWRVIGADFVTIEDGTGIVHIAPAFGEDDYNAGKENDLPLINPIAPDGKFTSDIPELEGIFAKDADPKIISILDERQNLVAKFPYEHDYPFCWRCNTPLLYYSMKSWFVKVSDSVDKLLKQNEKIKWYPQTIGSGRFGNWLENARDWGLSRNRFWGTPLPIWVCECGEKKAIGSKKELVEAAVGDVPKDLDLHRPYVDEIKLKCGCGKHMERVDYVIDCWYDSGAAPFAQYHYPFENKELFHKSFPFDFISEAMDQTRGWFYTLLVLGTLIFENPAYKSCVVGGLLLDEAGEKMSKSKNNIVNPWDLFNTVGADAVRLQMCATAPWNAKRFGIEGMKEQVIPMLRTLWNCYSFTVRYMQLDNFDSKTPTDHAKYQVEDKWIISRTDTMLEELSVSYLEHNYHHVLSKINNFIVEDLSRWYIKLIRDRLWLEDLDGKLNPSKAAAYSTLMQVFERTCIALAPLAPFITEEIHLNLLGSNEKSIHHMMWPKSENIDARLNSNMDVVRSIFESGSRARQDAKIKLRYPISSVTISGDKIVEDAVNQLSEIIKKQLNCKKVEYKEVLDGVSYEVNPDFKAIGPKYGKNAKNVADTIRGNPEIAIKISETKENMEISGYEISPDMISDLRLVVDADHSAAAFKTPSFTGLVLIDTHMTETLLNEALSRDFIRHIQELRKKHNLGELDRITVTASKNPKMKDMISEFGETVKEELRADSINLEKDLKTDDYLKFEGFEVFLGIKF